MASILELAGVALAALLSENFVLVSCMGIGTRTEAFRDPMDAVRTGYCLTAVMVLGALCAWLIDFFLLGRFGLAALPAAGPGTPHSRAGRRTEKISEGMYPGAVPPD